MRRSLMDAALVQPWWSRSSRLDQLTQGSISKPFKRSSTEDLKFQPLLYIRQEEKRERGGECEEEQAQRAASQQLGPLAPGGRNGTRVQ